MSKWHRLLLVIVAWSQVAAVNSAEPVKPPPLAGSSWELVSVQSMDDAIGTKVVEDPALYTLDLGVDGRAALRLNCNRGTASWEASASADGTSGTMRFGPLAATRALCPPPSLDEQLARDMDHVRGFLLRDGQLHLSLMADGAIYSWRPATGARKLTGNEGREGVIPGSAPVRDVSPVPVPPADYGNAADPVAGTVLGAAVRTRDAEELRYVVVQRLTDRYAEEHGIEATPAEIDAHIARVAAAMAEDRARNRARRVELEERLADGALAPADRAALAGELRQVESFIDTLDSMQAEAAKNPAQDRADRETSATAFVRQWKMNRALHAEFGGRIAFQQGGPEPVDAYRIFLEQAMARGDFAIADPALEPAFWRYYRDDSIHSFYEPGSAEEARAFAAPGDAATP